MLLNMNIYFGEIFNIYQKASNGWDLMIEKRTFQAIKILQQTKFLSPQYKIQAFVRSNKSCIDVWL